MVGVWVLWMVSLGVFFPAWNWRTRCFGWEGTDGCPFISPDMAIWPYGWFPGRWYSHVLYKWIKYKNWKCTHLLDWENLECSCFYFQSPTIWELVRRGIIHDSFLLPDILTPTPMAQGFPWEEKWRMYCSVLAFFSGKSILNKWCCVPSVLYTSMILYDWVFFFSDWNQSEIREFTNLGAQIILKKNTGFLRLHVVT